MSFKLKGKVSAVIRKFFNGSNKTEAADVPSGSENVTNSPVRRSRRVAQSIHTIGASKPIDTTIRTRRLMKEYKEIQRLQNLRPNPAFTVELINENLYEWLAHLYLVDAESQLAEDMREMGIPYILLHIEFPDNFPFAPPFMRVVEPCIERGFVMEGGAICMELLTPRGWASAYTVEALLMQFSASIVKGQGRIVKPKSCNAFNRQLAKEAFKSLVKTHEKYGWVTPIQADG